MTETPKRLGHVPIAVTDSTAGPALTPTAIREYDRAALPPGETATATFGLGCFWGPDAEFGGLPGVVRTRVGYAGGTRDDPTYHALGDHTEVLQVEFDPDQLTYRDLLERVFEAHDPRNQPRKRQYQRIVLTHGDEQREALEAVLGSLSLARADVETRLEPLEELYLAEPYHQKHNLGSRRWLTESFDEIGYDDGEIRDSPAAAKLNAHLGGQDVDIPFLDARGDRSD